MNNKGNPVKTGFFIPQFMHELYQAFFFEIVYI